MICEMKTFQGVSLPCLYLATLCKFCYIARQWVWDPELSQWHLQLSIFEVPPLVTPSEGQGIEPHNVIEIPK